jgi:hypothetical protein
MSTILPNSSAVNVVSTGDDLANDLTQATAVSRERLPSFGIIGDISRALGDQSAQYAGAFIMVCIFLSFLSDLSYCSQFLLAPALLSGLALDSCMPIHGHGIRLLLVCLYSWISTYLLFLWHANL